MTLKLAYLGGVFDAEVGEDSLGKLAELQLGTEVAQLLVVRLLQQQRILIEGYGGIETDGCQLFGEKGVLRARC